MTDKTSETSVAQRTIAFTLIALVVLSFVTIIATMIATLSKVTLTSGIWPVVFTFPLIALPAAAALMIALFVVSARKRTRENRETRR